MKRSLGKLSKRSRLLRKRIRTSSSVAKAMTPLAAGDRVHLTHISTRSMPHPRYRGKTGMVVGKRGGAYLVRVMDQNASKLLIIEGAHLTKAK